MRYEGYGPGGVAIIVEALTDNRNRTAGEVRSIFTKAAATSPRPARCRSCSTTSASSSIDAQGRERGRHAGGGASRPAPRTWRRREDGHEIITTLESLREVAKALEAKFGEPRKAALIWKPQNTVPVDDEAGEKMLKLIDALERQ